MKPLLRDILAKITGGDQRAIRWLERIALASAPEGGTTGQVLAKASGNDFDTHWIAVAASAGSGSFTLDDGTALAGGAFEFEEGGA